MKSNEQISRSWLTCVVSVPLLEKQETRRKEEERRAGRGEPPGAARLTERADKLLGHHKVPTEERVQGHGPWTCIFGNMQTIKGALYICFGPGSAVRARRDVRETLLNTIDKLMRAYAAVSFKRPA